MQRRSLSTALHHRPTSSTSALQENCTNPRDRRSSPAAAFPNCTGREGSYCNMRLRTLSTAQHHKPNSSPMILKKDCTCPQDMSSTPTVRYTGCTGLQGSSRIRQLLKNNALQDRIKPRRSSTVLNHSCTCLLGSSCKIRRRSLSTALQGRTTSRRTALRKDCSCLMDKRSIQVAQRKDCTGPKGNSCIQFFRQEYTFPRGRNSSPTVLSHNYTGLRDRSCKKRHRSLNTALHHR